MILKWLLLIGIVYLAYRVFARPSLLGGRRDRQIREQEPDEYADYEEID